MKNLKLEIKWAILFSAISLIWFGLEKILGLHNEKINQQLLFGYLFIIPAILIYGLAIAEKKKIVFNGNLNWKQGMTSGVFISFFVAFLSLIVNYICLQIISPQYLDNMIANVVATKQMTLENAKGYFNLKSYMLQGFSGALSMGVVTSAIVAFFLQTKSKKII